MTYTHHVPGRIRVRSTALKENPGSAETLRRWLQSAGGVQRVEANPLTGSMLIHYDRTLTDGAALLAELRDRKWIGAPARPLSPAPRPARGGSRAAMQLRPVPSVKRLVAKAILACVVEAALQRSVLALAAAIL